MKKFVAILLVILVAFGGFMTWNHLRAETGAPADVFVPAEGEVVSDTPADTPAEDAAPAEPVEVRHVDYDAIRALHPEDETVLTVAGETADWGEFFDLLRSTGVDIEAYFEQMGAYYGVAADWEGSVGDGSGQTFAQYAVSEAREYLESILTVRAFAKENGVELDEDTPQALAEQIMRFHDMSPEERADIGKNAKEGAKDFDFSVLTDKLIRVLESVTACRDCI